MKSAAMHRSDEEIADAVRRMVRALGRRVAESDPEAIVLLESIGHEVATQTRVAVAGWRESGFTDGMIGGVLGVTKQAVQQRWPREES